MSTFQFEHDVKIPLLVTARWQRERKPTRHEEGQAAGWGIDDIEFNLDGKFIVKPADIVNYIFKHHYDELKKAAEEQE